MLRKVAGRYLQKFFIWATALLVAGCAIIGLYSAQLVPFFFGAYLISAIFAGSNLLVMRKIDVNDNKQFFKIFGWSFAGRFAGVILVLVFVLLIVNIHEFFFTVSFLISYICHSIIEIIFLNKILKTDTEQ